MEATMEKIEVEELRQNGRQWLAGDRIWLDLEAALTGMVFSNIFYFHPYLGKWSNLTNIFQMGWNHQPVKVWKWHQAAAIKNPWRWKTFTLIERQLTFPVGIKMVGFLEVAWGRWSDFWLIWVSSGLSFTNFNVAFYYPFSKKIYGSVENDPSRNGDSSSTSTIMGGKVSRRFLCSGKQFSNV